MSFGEDDPRSMPRHFFWRHRYLDYDSAVKADVARQNYSVCPRYWYIDATFQCKRCRTEFCFTNIEQKAWYEEYGFWVDSRPKHCLHCRHELRELKSARQEYDCDIADALRADDMDRKLRLAAVIDQLCEEGGDLPERIAANRELLARQIARMTRRRDDPEST